MTTLVTIHNVFMIPLIEGTCVTIIFFQKPLARDEFNYIHQLKHISLMPQKDPSNARSPQGPLVAEPEKNSGGPPK
jgi:hypothetical protein